MGKLVLGSLGGDCPQAGVEVEFAPLHAQNLSTPLSGEQGDLKDRDHLSTSSIKRLPNGANFIFGENAITLVLPPSTSFRNSVP
jgi:hypothetical protein